MRVSVLVDAGPSALEHDLHFLTQTVSSGLRSVSTGKLRMPRRE